MIDSFPASGIRSRLSLMRHVVLFAFLLVSGSALAAGDGKPDYDHVVTSFFWGDLYAEGGWSLYCGYHFDPGHRTPQGRIIESAHIYPVDWMLEVVDCSNRLQCFEDNNRRFLEMEADLHNLYPVWQALVTLRGNLPFGEVDGEDWRFSDCDYEWNANVVEPRSIARGNIARAIFYMQDEYGLPVDPSLLETLRAWNREDPPSSQEQYRNQRIEQLQGRRNPYIDRPSLVDEPTLTLQEK